MFFHVPRAISRRACPALDFMLEKCEHFSLLGSLIHT